MKQARLAAGWLKQKSKLLPVIFVFVLVGTMCMPALVSHASAVPTVTTGGNGADAVWQDNYQTLLYNGQSFKYGSGTTFYGPVVNQCKTQVVFKNKNFQNETTASYQPGMPINEQGAGALSCVYTKSTTITVDSQANNDPTTTGGNPKGQDPANQSDPCDASNNPLSWFVCPLIGLVNEGVIQMQRVIDNLMQVNVGDVFDYTKQPGKGYYAAWNSFRLFAIVLIIIAGLIMVISQALGFDLFDAYTVKKVLPRLFVAAIGISLSWWLLKYLAQLTNDLGIGIRGIIYYPFREMGGAGLQNTGSYVYSLLIGAVALLVLGPGGILSLVVTAFLAALVAFLVLIIRQLVLIFLILIAPLAIACYVLPNTEKAYKLWWDSIFKGMMMFPIITGFIAMGRVFSVVASNSTSGAGASVNQIIALIAFFLPYFALPFTFRLAGGAMATIAGLTNDRSRGAFDRLKNYRANKAATNMRKTANFSRFSEKSAIGRGVNTALGTAFNPTAAMHGKRGIQARRLARQTMEGASFTKDNAIFQANQNDDNFLLAMANRDLAQQKLTNAQRNAQLATNDEDRKKFQQEVYARQKGLDAANQIPMASRNSRATQFASLQALARTGYQFETGEEGYKELRNTVDKIVGSDQGARAAAMDEMQFYLKNAGRFDLGGINHGAGYSYETGVNKSSGYTAGNAKVQTFEAGMQHFLKSTGKDGTGKKQTSEALGGEILAKYNAGTVKAGDIAAWHARLIDAEPGAIGGNKDEIIRQRKAIEAAAQGVARQIEAAGPRPFTSGEPYADEDLLNKLRENTRRSRLGMDPNLMEDK